MLHAMMARGIQIDPDHFRRMSKVLQQDMDRMTEEVKQVAGHYINLGSGDQVAHFLFKELGLKQARQKFTKSGKRESVENDVLVAVQHEHPVVSKLLNYKEYEKLKGTYADPIPLLAKKVDGRYRLLPQLKDTRVPSGRFSCDSPNLLAMPNRTERGRELLCGFITDPGWVILSVDECLHPHTEVETVLGPKPICQIKEGDKVLTHRGKTIDYGIVTRSLATMPKLAYRITFDNGESVIASYDHRWPTLTPRKRFRRATILECRTEDLQVGTRMVPCRAGVSSAGYLTWYSHLGATAYRFQHHIIAEAFLGPRPPGYHIHHRDENILNNHPTNLEYLWGDSHRSYHMRKTYKVQDHEYRIARLREGIQQRRTYTLDQNPNAKLSGDMWDRILMMVEDNVPTRMIAEQFGITPGYVRDLARGRRGPKREQSENHRVTRIECVGVQPMWAITVEPDHNYVLSCGVVSHNSQIEPRTVAHRSEDPRLMGIYEHKEDIYSDFAISAFRLPDQRHQNEQGKWKYPGVDKKLHRFPSKTCILASIYRVTNKGLLEQMPVLCEHCLTPAADHDPGLCPQFTPMWNEDNCQDIINSFYLRYAKIAQMQKMDDDRARKRSLVWDDWGRFLHVTAVRSVHPWVVAAALREAGNLPIQSFACGTLKLAMAQVFDELSDIRYYRDVWYPLLPIHDEILSEVRADVAEEIGDYIASVFTSCVELRVPLAAEYASAEVWGNIVK